MRFRRLGRQHGDPIWRRTRAERIDRSLGSGGREYQEVAGLVEGQVDGVQRIIALDSKPLGRRPAIDALHMTIDEVELAGSIHGCAGDGIESVFQFLDPRAGLQHRGGIARSGLGRLSGNIQHGKLPFAHLQTMGHILNGILVGKLADT